MELSVLRHGLDRSDDPVAVDLDPPDVIAVAPGLRDEDPADPFSAGKQVVRVRADDQVDVVLKLRCDPPVVPRRELMVVAEMREKENELCAARAEPVRCRLHALEHVAPAEAPVEIVRHPVEGVGHAHDPELADEHGRNRAVDAGEVRKQLRIGRHAGVLGQRRRAVTQPAGIADRCGVAARDREQAVHRGALRDVREPIRRLLDVSGVEVEHRMICTRPLALDERRDLGDPLLAAVNVVGVEDRQAQWFSAPARRDGPAPRQGTAGRTSRSPQTPVRRPCRRRSRASGRSRPRAPQTAAS